MQAVSELCDRAHFLKSTVQMDGDPADVIARYLSASGTRRSVGGGPIDILGARLSDPAGAAVSSVSPGTPLQLTVEYAARQPLDDLEFGIIIYRSTDGLKVYSGRVPAGELGIDPLPSRRDFTLQFGFRPHLTRGQYHIECHVFDNRMGRSAASLSPAAVFAVAETRTFAGIADVELECSVLGEVDAPAARLAAGVGP